MKIGLLISLFFLCFTSYATTYYVSSTGNNSNTGTTVSKSWQTISVINAKNFKGDTILFQGGSTFTGSMHFTSLDVGSSSKPIVIGSYGTGKATISSDTSFGAYIYNAAGFKIQNLIFKGSGRTTNKSSGVFFYMDKDATLLSYININNVEAYGYRNSGICIGSWKGISGFKDVSVTNSLVRDNGSAGIFLYAETRNVHKNIYIGYNKAYNNSGIPEQTTVKNSGSGIALGSVDGAIIEYCSSYNNGWLHSNSSGGPIGIWAYASNNVTMQFNESHHNKTGNSLDGGGFDLDGSSNSIMQYNYSHDNYGSGYLIARYSSSPEITNITIRYNISENDGRKNTFAGIHLWSYGTTIGIKNVQIYNNTIYVTPNTNANPKAFHARDGLYSGINVRNNIFQTTGGFEIVNVGRSGFAFQVNDYWSSGSNFKIYWKGTTYYSLASWRTATGQEKLSDGSSSGLQLDPQFATTTTGVTFSNATQITQLKRYKLKSTSGLINKGLNLTRRFGINVGTRDFWKNSIVNKSTFNIGAYQLTTGAKPITNVTEELQNNQLNAASLQVFPNPISSNATVSFALPELGKASIVLHNVDGKLIKLLFSGEMKAGELKKLSVSANGLPDGLYIISLFSGEKFLTQKIVISK